MPQVSEVIALHTSSLQICEQIRIPKVSEMLYKECTE